MSSVDLVSEPRELVGFIGLGIMGGPIATRLARSGEELLVWNRTPARVDLLRAEGAQAANSVDEVFARARLVFVMLANGTVVDSVLGRGTSAFAARVRDRTVVALGTTAPDYSRQLGRDIEKAGGHYVEAPVSGSRPVAEAGKLVALLAGGAEETAHVSRVLKPVCQDIIECGPVPAGLNTKLAVNILLITMVTGLAEAWSFAERSGIDLETFRRALDSGPMASMVSRIKTGLLLSGEFQAQTAMTDVLYNSNLITTFAAENSIPTPLMDTCQTLLEHAVSQGIGDLDMAAVVKAFDDRTAETGR